MLKLHRSIKLYFWSKWEIIMWPLQYHNTCEDGASICYKTCKTKNLEELDNVVKKYTINDWHFFVSLVLL